MNNPPVPTEVTSTHGPDTGTSVENTGQPGTNQPPGASLHLGGEAWAHPDLAPLLRPIESVTPYPGNPRRGDQDGITGSIRDHGLYAGVVTQAATGHVLVGNHRLRSLLELGAKLVPVTEAAVDDTRAAAIVARDNLTSDRATNDPADLLSLLTELSEQSALDLSGFTPVDMNELAAMVRSNEGPLTDPDDVPPPPVTPVTQLGDVWQLGPHRVMCGDALSDLPLDTLLDGETPALIYTDPPYGISIVNRPSAGQGKVGGSKPVTIQGKVGHALGSETGFSKGNAGAADQQPPQIVRTKWYDPVIGDETTDTAARSVRSCLARWPKARHVWWGANHYAGDATLPNASCWLVWDKQTGENTFADAELAWTNHKGAVRLFTHRWNGLLRDSERGSSARVHPTQKPVALAIWCYQQMLGHKLEGAVVLDIFGGSGSALIAAEQVGAVARIMELSPAYCDVICRRYQQHTGTIPTRNGEQVTFL